MATLTHLEHFRAKSHRKSLAAQDFGQFLAQKCRSKPGPEAAKSYYNFFADFQKLQKIGSTGPVKINFGRARRKKPAALDKFNSFTSSKAVCF